MQVPVGDGWGRLVPAGVTRLQWHCHAGPGLGQSQLQRAQSFPLCKALQEMQKGKRFPFPGQIGVLLSPQDGTQGSN